MKQRAGRYLIALIFLLVASAAREHCSAKGFDKLAGANFTAFSRQVNLGIKYVFSRHRGILGLAQNLNLQPFPEFPHTQKEGVVGLGVGNFPSHDFGSGYNYPDTLGSGPANEIPFHA